MKSRNILLLLGIMIFSDLLLVSCSRPKINSFLIGDSNCQVPCWNSITPGITSRSQALSTVAELEDINNFSSTDTDAYFKYKAQRVHLIFDSATQIVEMIGFELDETSLGQIVDLFGEPESLSFVLNEHGRGGTILVHYPKTGQYFDGLCKTTLFGNDWKVTPSIKITRGFLFNPAMDEARLNRLLFGDAIERVKDGIIDWDGYKIYPF